jgi:hypothetical protein
MSAELADVANPRLVQALLDRDPAEVEHALRGATLLVPASEPREGEVVVETRRAAGAGALVCAFTDLEALAAWDRDPPGAAVALDAAAVGELVPDATVALNPAGPGAHLIDGHALVAAEVASGLNGGPQPAVSRPSELTDPPARRALRDRANLAHELARHHAEAGELDRACEEMQPVLEACTELGDRLHGAAAAIELAGWRAGSGRVQLALAGWREAAETMALLGELDLALGALLDAAEAAAAAELTTQAESLSIAALDLAAGSEFADRLVTLWRRLDGR